MQITRQDLYLFSQGKGLIVSNTRIYTMVFF